MAINFNKDHSQIVNAYKEVLDPQFKTNWALFGYDKLSNDLILVDKGDGGLEELYNEFSQSKILYAFCEAKDQKNQVSRYILINWQGECAPMQRKGACMAHFRDVNSFFKGAHVTLNARNEDDVEPSVLMQHVSKLTSRIKIDKPNEELVENDRKPIGTTYKRIVPQNEISKTEREQFWQKQKQEEDERLQEKKRKESQLKLDISNVKRDDAPDVEPRGNQSALLRKERLEEAKQVSKNSVNSAKAFFEQNSAASQINQKPERVINIRDTTPQAAPLPKEQPIHGNGQSNGQLNGNSDHHMKDEEVDDFAEKTVEEKFPSGFVASKPEVAAPVETGEDSANDEQYSSNVSNFQPQFCNFFPESRTLENIEEELVNEDGEVLTNKGDDLADGSQGLRAKALYDYQAADDTEISFDPDDIITHIEQIDAGWWQGLAPSGTYGLFPANYVELLE